MRRRRTVAFLSVEPFSLSRCTTDLAYGLGARTALVVLLTACAAACSSKPEDPILQQFFRASRLNDSTSLSGLAVAKFNPQTDGTVANFKIVNVSLERRTPLHLSALAGQHEAARAEDAEFTKKKDSFYLDNTEAIARVLKAESAGAKVAGKDADVQATWAKLRDESSQFAKKVADARRKLKAESGVVQLSLENPNNPVDSTKYDGELVTKDVTVTAPVRLPNGASADRTLVVTMQRAVLKANPEIAGKWIIMSVRDTTSTPAAKTS